MAAVVTDEVNVQILGDHSGGMSALREIAQLLNQTAGQVAASEQKLTRIIQNEKKKQEGASERAARARAQAEETAAKRAIAEARRANDVIAALIARGDPLKELRLRTRKELALLKEAAERSEFTEEQKERARLAILRRYSDERARIFARRRADEERSRSPLASTLVRPPPGVGGGGVLGAVGGLSMRAIGAIGGVSAATAAAGFAARELVTTTREFDILNASLITATGSAEGAEKAFSAIQDLAIQTPYDLQQVTDAFVRLVNYGLTPSERAIVSYGNIAAAMGKDLNQFTEAVADAITGEFERLKEFGVRASKDGDVVRFTFRGMTETVKFSATEIEDYLIRLGENNFAGAMEERMRTLDGAMSNFGDAWDQLFLAISKAGTGALIEEGFRKATEALERLTVAFQSGEIDQHVEAWTDQLNLLKEAAEPAINSIQRLYESVMRPGEDGSRNFFSRVAESIVRNLGVVRIPADLRAFSEIMQSAASGDMSVDRFREILQRREQAIDSFLGKVTTAHEKTEEFLNPEFNPDDPIMQGPVFYSSDRLVRFGKQGSTTSSSKAEDKAREQARKAREKELEQARKLVEKEEELWYKREVIQNAESEQLGKIELERREALVELENLYAAKITLGEADLEWEQEYLRRREEINAEAKRKSDEVRAEEAARLAADTEKRRKQAELQAEKIREAAERELERDERTFQAGMAVGFSFIRGMREAAESGEAEDVAKAFLGLVAGIASFVPGGGFVSAIAGGIASLFHNGGTIGPDGRPIRKALVAHNGLGYIGTGAPGDRPGTRRVDALVGESVLNVAATNAMGGSAGVARYNRMAASGMAVNMGGFSPNVTIQVDGSRLSISDIERELPDMLRRAMIASRGPVERAFVDTVGRNFGR